MKSTRPYAPHESTVPVELGIPPLPPPPADLAEMLVRFIEARRDERLVEKRTKECA